METLCRNSIELIKYSRSIVVQHINTVETMTYYVLGKWIIEEQQQGKDRAKYGERGIDNLSAALKKESGKGFSRETLRNARKFYQIYKDRIPQTLFTEFTELSRKGMKFGK